MSMRRNTASAVVRSATGDRHIFMRPLFRQSFAESRAYAAQWVAEPFNGTCGRGRLAPPPSVRRIGFALLSGWSWRFPPHSVSQRL